MSYETAQNLPATLAQENLLRRIIDRIRRSLELKDVLQATAAEVGVFLGTDRVKIYQFQPDGSGQVVAESIQDQRLPSLLGLNFPAEDIPLFARDQFVKVRVRSIVNVKTQQIGLSGLKHAKTGIDFAEVQYRPADPCHIEYLIAMGVQSSLVMPLLVDDQLWGLFASHHSQPREVLEAEVRALQLVVDQLSVAIAQSFLITQARDRATREAAINRITCLLHSLSTIELQAALDETVTTLQGSGGRLWIRAEALNFQNGLPDYSPTASASPSCIVRLYTSGSQPKIPQEAHYQLMEQYSVWHEFFKSGEPSVWAVSNLYKEPSLQNLQLAFRLTKIRGILIVPLWYRHQLLGYLSVFRDEIETETLWAGQVDEDCRQRPPLISFEVWQESKKGQSQPWTLDEVELIQMLGKQFATAIQQYELHQHLQTLNASLERQVEKRTAQLKQQAEQLAQTLDHLRKTQNQLVQTEKMSSLGHLVAGVAHEINNPVNFIYGNLKHVNDYAHSLLKLVATYQTYAPHLDADVSEQIAEIDLDFLAEDLPKTLTSMEVGADRIRQIVLSLRNFSRLDQADTKFVDIHEGLDSTLLILQHRFKAKAETSSIELIKEYGELPQVECYAGQLNQVFMNVISNALDALEELGEPRNGTVGARSKIQNPTIWIRTQQLNDNRVLIRIADNGFGIPTEFKAQVFDAFFTTKPIGKGTGMGLSISYQIVVDKHGGVFKYDSQPGQGTEFWIEIPIRRSP